MEKTIHIPAKHAEHINWNSIVAPMINIWQRILVTKDSEGDITVTVVDEEKIGI